MEGINLDVLDAVLVRYQSRLAETRKNEIYKWEAVRHFKETWKPDSDDLGAMLVDAFQHDKKLNLIWYRTWFPIGMLSWFAYEDTNGTLDELNALFDESVDLKSRMVSFESWAREALAKLNVKLVANGEGPARSHFQDPRSMSVYLAFRYPDAHYLYKAGMYRRVAKILGVGWPGNKFDKVIAYHAMCDQILGYVIEHHPDLVRESDALLGDLVDYDPEHHMLVQDIVYFMDHYDDGRVAEEELWRPTEDEYDPGIDADDWESLLRNDEVFTESALGIVRKMLDLGGSATCTQLAEQYGNTKEFYNAGIRELGRRVARVSDCRLMQDENGGTAWFAVVCVGKRAKKEELGSYIWRLRDELIEALDKLNDDPLPVAPLVPDGDESERGHWLLVANAKIWTFSELEIGAKTSYTIYNEKGNPRRIHKNYLAAKPGDLIIGYESTPTRRVVALCVVTCEHDDERLYFHKVCDINEGVTYDVIKADPILSGCEFAKNPNGSFFALTKAEWNRFDEMLGLEGCEDVEDSSVPIARVEESATHEAYSYERFLDEVFVSSEDLNDMVSLLERKRNLILQGSPGTGKTYCAKRLAWAMMDQVDDSRITYVQFHQSTTYDDFVCGYKPDGQGGFVVKNGPFIRACRLAQRDAGRPHFIIIDEINRANVSKVFGELLMLIEADHREVDRVLLTVSDETLTVPKNLYIIGMMNTADRGLALIDYALRRRFAFFEMVPALGHPHFVDLVSRESGERMMRLVEATKRVNDDIAKDPSLGEGFRIGHSYFCGRADPGLVFRYELAPLIDEYWFDDRKKAASEKARLEAALS